MKVLSWLFGGKQGGGSPRIFLKNTLSGTKELFVPLKPHQVTLYSCGPTVYGPAHIGNLRAYVFSDTVARVLMNAGYHVRRVINITDVGHLVGDGDEGEDKMAVGAAREQKSPAEIADRYTKLFLADLDELNIDTEHILFPKATEFIKEQIMLAKTLEERGFAYRTSDGLYFDTSKFPTYGALGGISGARLKEGARVAVNKEKKHANDFALWRVAKPNDLQQWDSPWGRGNPGWHIECSAMTRALLGIEVDIHTGGEDHIATHHNNEIAQSEAANGRRFVHYWMHNAFLTIFGERVAKSLKNDILLSDVVSKGYHPLSLRYLYLQAHYRSPVSFTWEAIQSADEALKRLWRHAREIKKESGGRGQGSNELDRFLVAVRDDLATPQALAILWDALKNEDLTGNEQWGLIESAEAHFGLSLTTPPESAAPLSPADLPADIRTLVEERERARAAGNYQKADQLRAEIAERGYHVEDRDDGPQLTSSHR